MASRYGAFTRSVRSAMHSSGSGRSSFRAAGSRPAPSNPRPHFNDRRTPLTNNAASLRRRWAETMIPLHNAVADAKLVSHLSVNTRDRSTLSLVPIAGATFLEVKPRGKPKRCFRIFVDGIHSKLVRASILRRFEQGTCWQRTSQVPSNIAAFIITGLQIFLDAAFLNFCVRSPWPNGMLW